MYIIYTFFLFTVRRGNGAKCLIGEITHVNVSFFLNLKYGYISCLLSVCVYILHWLFLFIGLNCFVFNACVYRLRGYDTVSL